MFTHTQAGIYTQLQQMQKGAEVPANTQSGMYIYVYTYIYTNTHTYI